MNAFIKLTPESCKRMWVKVINAQCERIGRVWAYQSHWICRSKAWKLKACDGD